MQKLNPNDPETMSTDLLNENVEQLKTLFPEAVVERKIDFEVLKQLLGSAIDEREEKYGLNWHGKKKARQLALTPSTGTLRPCPEDSAGWDSTQNIMIEGDNLEVLKLLQKSYAGKVKLIYIDPPYNKDADVIYQDDFAGSIENYLMLTGQIDSDGRKLSSVSEASGRMHTDWLSMIYPRIKVAHSLLTEDGAIFVSCDETEQPRLRLVLDEVFGQENFVADMIWAAGRKNDSRLVSISHEYMVCYARKKGYLTEQKIEWRQRKKGLEEIYAQHSRLQRQHGTDYAAMTAGMKAWFKELADSHPAKAHKHYSHVDFRGVYFPDNISWPGGGGPKYEVLHPKTGKPVSVPSRGWMTSDPDKMKQWIKDELVHFGEDESAVPCIKSYLKDREYQAPYSVFYQDGRAATKRLRELMGADCFDFPKDEGVLQELVGMMTTSNDIVMDFFAGSGTTGHAVMAQNATDSCSRRFILVQLPEELDSDKAEQKIAADYCDHLGKPRRISELTKERLRRAGSQLKASNPLFAGDFGFRVFRLDASNVIPWDTDSKDLEQSLLSAVTNIKEDRTEADILNELLIKLGLDLCVPIEEREITGKTVHSVGAGALMVCLATKIDRSEIEPLAQGIVGWHKELDPAAVSSMVFLDSAFADDVSKTNMTAILGQHGLLKVRSL